MSNSGQDPRRRTIYKVLTAIILLTLPLLLRWIRRVVDLVERRAVALGYAHLATHADDATQLNAGHHRHATGIHRPDSHQHAAAYTDAIHSAQSDANGNRDVDTHPDEHGDCDRHANAHTDFDRDADGHGN